MATARPGVKRRGPDLHRHPVYWNTSELAPLLQCSASPCRPRPPGSAVLNDTDLFVTLAFTLGIAGIGALAAAFFRQSLVLGYILAGMVMGPHTPGFVADIPTVEELADVGVIFLMFAIGVQLSFSDLRRVGRVALLGGGAQVLLTIGIVYLVGRAVGFGWLEALFFGAVISNSSSTVLSKVLSERGDLDSVHGRISLAWSTVQDFSTVALAVILTTLSKGTTDTLVIDLAKALGLAALFLLVTVPAGLLLLPRFFERVSALGNVEVFTFAAAGVALGVAYLADVFGISVALGAFVAGILVGRSDVSHEVEGRLAPLRDLFAGLFFVSVGMLIDLEVVVDNLWLVALTVALIIGLKGVMSGAIALLFGYRGRTVVLTGALLAQSAEFSFLLARLGTDLDAISSEVFGLMLAGAAISIVLAPVVFAGAQPLGRLVERKLPLPPVAGPDDARMANLSNHAILCGFGRVGRVVYDALRQQSIAEVVVIEQDPGTVASLRERGVPVLQGSASNLVVLERAGLSRARMLIAAIPDPLSVRRIVEIAREHNPRIDIVARTHSQSERRYVEAQGANEAVVGELELAIEMSRRTLHQFDVPELAAESLLRRVRAQSQGE